MIHAVERPTAHTPTHCTPAQYDAMYRASVETPDAFWLEQAQRLDWITPPTRASESSFGEADFGIQWFTDGTLNVSANCLDRHLAERGDVIAILWEPDDPADAPRSLTYRELHAEVCRFANVLKDAGARRGDRSVTLPMAAAA